MTSSIRCMDCKRDTGSRGLREYPLMLRDEVWLSITAETGGTGMLCRADMERRLGRQLTADDICVDGWEQVVRKLDDRCKATGVHARP